MDMRSLRHHRRCSEMGFQEQCPHPPSSPPLSPSPLLSPSTSLSPSNNTARGIEKLVSKVVRDLKARRESLITHTGMSMSLVQFAASSPLAWIPLHSSPTPRVSPNFLRHSKPKSSPRSSPSSTRMPKMMLPPSSPSFTSNLIDSGQNLEKKDKNRDNVGAEIDEKRSRVKVGEKIVLRVFGNWVTLSMMAMGFLCTGKGAALGITMAAFLIFRLIYLLNPGVKSIISSSLPPADPSKFPPLKMESLSRNDQPEHQKSRKKKSSLRASIRSLTVQVPKRGLVKPQKPIVKAASLPSRFILVEKPGRSFRPQVNENWVINETVIKTSSGRRRRSAYEAFPVIGFIVLGMAGLLHGHIMAIAITSSWLLLLSKLMPYLNKSCYGHIDRFPHVSLGSVNAHA